MTEQDRSYLNWVEKNLNKDNDSLFKRQALYENLHFEYVNKALTYHATHPKQDLKVRHRTAILAH